ncbi:kunitz-type serine protease inhibitor homolog delta-dendrotoxin-like [Drosophila madeirensis]|uniref:Kunitz-type serine protease inhibitor homolog delta-dendrotoxin-like n=1 Tax=Drosophila madeirensis TaxID=30013 RepID=A0AAU9F766_DROMD
MFWQRLVLIFLALWTVLVSGGSEESEEFQNPKLLRVKSMLKERRAICYKGPSYGSCKGKRKMWNFNFRSKKCVPFTFSNCGGNRNRFHSQDDCEKFCSEEHWKTSDIYSKK